MVSSTCLHFRVSRAGHTCHTKFSPDLPSSISIIPGIPAVALGHSCPILLTIEGGGEIIAVGMIITQSQQESQNKTGTQQEQEEHT